MIKHLIKVSGTFPIIVGGEKIMVALDYLSLMSPYFARVESIEHIDADPLIFESWLELAYSEMPDMKQFNLATLAQLWILNEMFECDIMKPMIIHAIRDCIDAVKYAMSFDEWFRTKFGARDHECDRGHNKLHVPYYEIRCGAINSTHFIATKLWAKIVDSTYFAILEPLYHDKIKLIMVTHWTFEDALKYPQYKKEIIESMYYD